MDDYNWLRRHIHGQFNLITQIFIASVIASGALLGYIIKIMVDGSIAKSIEQMQATPNDFNIAPFLLLTPIIIVLPSAYLISTLRKEIFLWGMYIKVFLENEKVGGWETHVSKFREKFNTEESFNPISITYISFILVCFLLFMYVFVLTKMSLWWILVPLVPIVLFFLWFMDYRTIPSRCSKEFEKKWRIIKKDIKKRG